VRGRGSLRLGSKHESSQVIMAERKRGRTCEERAGATRIAQRILALSRIARWKRPCVVPCDVISVRPLGPRLARSQTPAANPWWQGWVGEPLTLRASAAERRSVSPGSPPTLDREGCVRTRRAEGRAIGP
jgi:hypothetical protein